MIGIPNVWEEIKINIRRVSNIGPARLKMLQAVMCIPLIVLWQSLLHEMKVASEKNVAGSVVSESPILILRGKSLPIY